LQYLNPKGIIPPMAVIKKGQKRDNPFKEKKRFDASSFPVAKGGQADTEGPDGDDDEESTLDRKQLADMEG
jgi:tRNA pseudouridine38-40 synthase